MGMNKLILSVLGIMTMLAVPTYAQQDAGAVTYDPFSLLFLLLVSAVVIGLAVYFFVVLRDSSNQTAVINAQVTALNSQVNNMNNLVQATVTALNVNTAISERESQHMINMDDRYYRLFEAQVMNDIYFKNTLLELYAMQLTSQDIRQLLSDKLKATALQAVRTPDVEVSVAENPRLGNQGVSQGTTSTK